MGAYFKLSVRVDRVPESKADKIIDDANTHWNFTESCKQKTDITDKKCNTVDIYLEGEMSCGYSLLDEHIESIVVGIWDNLGEYRDITVQSLCLEDLPWEDHCLNEEDYSKHFPGKEI